MGPQWAKLRYEFRIKFGTDFFFNTVIEIPLETELSEGVFEDRQCLKHIWKLTHLQLGLKVQAMGSFLCNLGVPRLIGFLSESVGVYTSVVPHTWKLPDQILN